MRQLRLVSELSFVLSSESELNLTKKQRDRELARLQVTCKCDRNLKGKIQQVLNGTETKDIHITDGFLQISSSAHYLQDTAVAFI